MEIDWGSAEVRDGKLTVGFTDKPPKEWRERFTAVLERLGGGGVEVKKEGLVVSGVEPGREGDVRHLLESALLQANADVAPDEEHGEKADAPSEADRDMTQIFRTFN